jgi:hypothetical protein
LGEFWSAITLCAPQQARFYELSIRCQAFFVRHSKSNRGPLLGLSFQKYFSQKSPLLPGFPEN